MASAAPKYPTSSEEIRLDLGAFYVEYHSLPEHCRGGRPITLTRCGPCELKAVERAESHRRTHGGRFPWSYIVRLSPSASKGRRCGLCGARGTP